MAQQNESTASLGQYKIVIVGDSGVGKSTFLTRNSTGGFTKEYYPTKGVKIVLLTFHTSYGTISFEVWDCSNEERLGVKHDNYKEAVGVITMFDRSATRECKNVNENFGKVEQWLDRVYGKAYPLIPTVVCGNKVDVLFQDCTNETYNRDKKDNARISSYMNALRIMYGNGRIVYFSTSAKSNCNLEEPFLYLARQLTGQLDLCFVESPLSLPVEVNLPLKESTHSKTNEEYYQLIIGVPPPNLPKVMFVPTNLVTDEVLKRMEEDEEDIPEFLDDEELKNVFENVFENESVRNRTLKNGVVKRVFVYTV